MLSLKSQIQKDIKNTFLNLDEFAELHHIRYFKNGEDAAPQDLTISVSIQEDGDGLKTWNKQETYQTGSRNQSLMQKNYVMFSALEDWGEAPKRKRSLLVDRKKYQIAAVEITAGMLEIKMRRLEE